MVTAATIVRICTKGEATLCRGPSGDPELRLQLAVELPAPQLLESLKTLQQAEKPLPASPPTTARQTPPLLSASTEAPATPVEASWEPKLLSHPLASSMSPASNSMARSQQTADHSPTQVDDNPWDLPLLLPRRASRPFADHFNFSWVEGVGLQLMSTSQAIEEHLQPHKATTSQVLENHAEAFRSLRTCCRRIEEAIQKLQDPWEGIEEVIGELPQQVRCLVEGTQLVSASLSGLVDSITDTDQRLDLWHLTWRQGLERIRLSSASQNGVESPKRGDVVEERSISRSAPASPTLSREDQQVLQEQVAEDVKSVGELLGRQSDRELWAKYVVDITQRDLQQTEELDTLVERPFLEWFQTYVQDQFGAFGLR